MLILTPFRSQTNLLRTLARAHLSHFPGVRTGTVHVSQGLEAELVLFDPVNPGHYWLQGGFGDDAIQRLLWAAARRSRASLSEVPRAEFVRFETLRAVVSSAPSEALLPVVPEPSLAPLGPQDRMVLRNFLERFH